MNPSALDHLLRAVRNRSWRAVIARQSHRGLWWAGASILGLGIVHRWLWPVSLPVALAVSLVPGVALLAWATLRGRPSLRQCARAADALFGGQELLVSAYEVSRGEQQHAAAAGTLVGARAATAAAQWRERLSSLPGVRHRMTLPVSLACAGVFLLANSGALLEPSSRTPAASSVQAVDATAPSLTGAQPLAPELAAAELRARPMVRGDAPGPPEDDAAGPTPLLLPDVLQRGINVSSQQEAGQLATAARPRIRPDGVTELPEMDVRLIVVDAVQTAAQLVAGGGGSEPDRTADPRAALVAGPGSRGVGTDPNGFNVFDPAQRRYAAVYFRAQAALPEETP